jgi:hypothetical protein
MKTVLAVIITLIIIGVAGYLFGPKLIMKENAPLRTEIAQLQSRLQAVEGFIKAEEEARQKTSLKPDTRLPDVVRTVNRLAIEQKQIEDSMQLGFKDVEGRFAEIKAANEDEQKKIAQNINDLSKKADQQARENELQSFMESSKARVLKIKIELVARNVGIAKGELNLLSQALENGKTVLGDNGNNKTVFERLQAMVKDIRTEMDSNLVAAMDRIDLLWHELEKLSRSG